MLRGWDPSTFRSSAEAQWLFGEEVAQAWEVERGTVIAVTEGVRLVAYFTVHEVRGAGVADP